MEFAKKCRDTRIQRDRFLMVTLQIGKEEKVPLIANHAFSHSRASVIAAAGLRPDFFLIIIADFEFDDDNIQKHLNIVPRLGSISVCR
jgi:hypothetical protein